MTEIHTLRADDDMADLIALSRDFFAEYEHHHEAFFKIDRLTDDDLVTYFTNSVCDADAETFIAITNGRTVGYITASIRTQPAYWAVKTIGHISGLMVHADHRRRSIATDLLAAAEGFFAARDVTYVTVYTSSRNRAAIEFYERRGMTPLYTTMIGQVGTTDTSNTSPPVTLRRILNDDESNGPNRGDVS